MVDLASLSGLTPFVQPDFASGIITTYQGSLSGIPNGWLLCDGTNGTPDLRDRFIVGSGSTYPAKATGGSILHDHAFTAAHHQHGLNIGTGLAGGPNFTYGTNAKASGGTTDNGATLPPYYSLAYIIKI